MVVKRIAQLVGGKSDYHLYEKTSEYVRTYSKYEFNKDNPLY